MQNCRLHYVEDGHRGLARAELPRVILRINGKIMHSSLWIVASTTLDCVMNLTAVLTMYVGRR